MIYVILKREDIKITLFDIKEVEMTKISASDKKLIEAMRGSVEYCMDNLVLKEKNPLTQKMQFAKPFFVSFMTLLTETKSLSVSEGAVTFKDIDRIIPMSQARGELRVGSYGGGSMVSMTPFIPQDKDNVFLKRDFWREANEALYEAMNELDEKRISSRGIKEKHWPFVYFSKEKPIVDFLPDKKININFDYWEDIFKRASRMFLRKEIVNSSLSVVYDFEKRFFVNSEGTTIIESFPSFELSVTAKILGDDNLVFQDTEKVRLTYGNELPDEEKLIILSERLIKNLYEIKKAPFEKEDVYPVIMTGDIFKVRVHEAVGHPSEAHRTTKEEEEDDSWFFDSAKMSLFQDRIGEQVAPNFLSVYNDPNLKGAYGSFKYDFQGVRSKKVRIIKDGILENLIHSRETAGWFSKHSSKKIKSNGHSRAQATQDPVPRMSNIIVKSKYKYTMEQLKEMLFKECKKQKKPYGLFIEGSAGGSIESDGPVNEFPRNIFRLYLDGRQERVNGVYMSNDATTILRNIVATSGNYKRFDGICGAESGDIPTSGIAPDAFVRLAGFKRISRSYYEQRFALLSKPPC